MYDMSINTMAFIETYGLFLLVGLLAVTVFVLFYYYTHHGKGYMLSLAVKTINEVFDDYGYIIRERDLQLYADIWGALNTTNIAVDDEYLELDDKIAVANSYAPLFKRLFDVVGKKWKGSVLVVDTN